MAELIAEHWKVVGINTSDHGEFVSWLDSTSPTFVNWICGCEVIGCFDLIAHLHGFDKYIY